MTEKNNAKVVLKNEGNGLRGIFVHLITPDDFGGREKYSITVLIDKKDKKTVSQVKGAIKAAMDKGLADTFKGKNPKKAASPLKDGDDEDTAKYPYYEGCYYLKFSTSYKPTVIDKARHALTEESDVYSGAYYMVSGFAMPYLNTGNYGVTFVLGNVLKVADGENLGGTGGFDIDDDFGDELDADDFADEDNEDEDEDDEDEEDEEDGLADALAELKKLEKKAKKIDRKEAKKLLKDFDLDDVDDVNDAIEELQEWIEDNA